MVEEMLRKKKKKMRIEMEIHDENGLNREVKNMMKMESKPKALMEEMGCCYSINTDRSNSRKPAESDR